MPINIIGIKNIAIFGFVHIIVNVDNTCPLKQTHIHTRLINFRPTLSSMVYILSSGFKITPSRAVGNLPGEGRRIAKRKDDRAKRKDEASGEEQIFLPAAKSVCEGRRGHFGYCSLGRGGGGGCFRTLISLECFTLNNSVKNEKVLECHNFKLTGNLQ